MKKLLYSLIAVFSLILSVTAVSAATLTTADGVLSIDTPDDSWAQVNDPYHWLTLTNGNDTITIDHLANGEKVPEVHVADSTYAAVYQAYVSTRNEVFVVKGLASETQDLELLMRTLGTIKVLKYDTKTAVQAAVSAPQASEFGFRAINATYYCTGDDVNVRSSYSTDTAKLGSLNKGQEAYVTAAVTKDGKDFGWYQISYNGGIGYVSSAFLSANKSGAAAAPAATVTPAPTDQAKPVGDPIAVFDANGNPKGYIYQYSDSSFRDQNGKKVDYERNGVYYNGTEYLYTSRHFEEEPYALNVGFTCYDSKGDIQGLLVPYSDGLYYSNDMTPYKDQGDGSYYSSVAEEYLYDYNPVSGTPSDSWESDDSPYQLNDGFTCYDSRGNIQGMLRPYSDGLYYSNDMTPYRDQGDGSYYSSVAGEYLYDYNPVSEDPSDSWESDGSDGSYYGEDEEEYLYQNEYGEFVEAN